MYEVQWDNNRYKRIRPVFIGEFRNIVKKYLNSYSFEIARTCQSHILF